MTTWSRKLTGGAGGLLSYFEQLREAAEDIAGYYSTRPPLRRTRDTDIVFDELWGKAAERGTATVQHGLRAGEESKMQGSRTVRVPAELLALLVVQFSARPTDETIARGSPPIRTCTCTPR